MSAGTPGGLSGSELRAARSWDAYWTFVGASYARPGIDPLAAQVAEGTALGRVQTYVGQLAQRSHRVSGALRVTVSRVRLGGSRGTVCGPVRDRTYEVDRAGRPVQPVTTVTSVVRGTLRERSGRWVVTSYAVVRDC